MAPELFELDPEPDSEPELMQLSVQELRERLRRRGLSDAGLLEKQELVERLRAAESSDDARSSTKSSR